jgi:hypothetical protein
MIQSYLYGLKQLREGANEIQDLLTPQETNHIQNQLTESQDIKIYNSCRRLWEYLEHVSYIAAIAKKDIDIVAFKLYFLITNEIKSESLCRNLGQSKGTGAAESKLEASIKLITIERDDNRLLVPGLFKELIYLLKQWFAFWEAMNLISQRMELPDLMILVDENPLCRISLVNVLIKDLQFLYPDNEISKALADMGGGNVSGVAQETDIIDINKLRPTEEKINSARKAIKDLTYFKDNWGIHSILGASLFDDTTFNDA